MTQLSDNAIRQLQSALDEPDLSGTRYELVSFLGSGGMGSVYSARDTELSRDVALKVLRITDPSGEFALRLKAEARITASLEHPGIVPIHDLGALSDGRLYYVSKLVQGERLDAFTQKSESQSEKLRLFLKVCEAVAFAHSRNVLHRDLKPANIMVGEFGEALILDWGLAEPQDMSPDESTRGGTKGYLAPELMRGGLATARADVYSLGGTLFYLLTRAAPDAGLLNESLRSLPKPLAAICRKALASAPEFRYDSVEALRRDIACFLDDRPVSAYRESPLEKVARFLSRHQFVVFILLAYMVIRLIFFLALKR